MALITEDNPINKFTLEYIYPVLKVLTKKLVVHTPFTMLQFDQFPYMEHLEFLYCRFDYLFVPSEDFNSLFNLTVLKEKAPNLKQFKLEHLCCEITVSFTVTVHTSNLGERSVIIFRKNFTGNERDQSNVPSF